jgi:hypothetical protein
MLAKLVPANAGSRGIHGWRKRGGGMDSRFRGNDEKKEDLGCCDIQCSIFPLQIDQRAMGWPASWRRILAMMCSVAVGGQVRLATCGVNVTLGWRQKGWLAGNGSSETTSSAAWARWAGIEGRQQIGLDDMAAARGIDDRSAPWQLGKCAGVQDAGRRRR